MFSKLIGLFGKILFWGFIALVISIVTLGGYFFYKSGQPMQVAEAQRIAPGITYREFWQDRIQRWAELDDQKKSQGKGSACVIGPILLQPWLFISGITEVSYVRLNRGTEKATKLIQEINGIIPPDDLIYGPFWKLPDAWWWQIENGTWFHYYRPLARAAYCELGTPHRPASSETGNP